MLPVALSQTATLMLTVGFLGTFTTFSTFALEATGQFRDGRAGAAMSYVATSAGLGLAAAAVGYTVGRY